MNFSKLIILFSFVLMFAACEDSPKEVGIYEVPPGNVAGKMGVMDGTDLKISIFNIGNFGGVGNTPSRRTRDRAMEIRDNLKNLIFTKNHIFIFLDVIGEKDGYAAFDEFIRLKSSKGVKGATCGVGEINYKGDVKRYNVVCHHPSIKWVRSARFESVDLQNEDLPAHGLKFKYTNKDDAKLDYEFFLAVLDYSRGLQRPTDQARERLTKKIAKEINRDNEGLPTIIIGDWRTNSEENEINKLHKVLNLELSDMSLFESEESTVIDTDEGSEVVKTYNNIVYSSNTWKKSSVKNEGACNKPDEMEDYKYYISENCPTFFVLKRL